MFGEHLPRDKDELLREFDVRLRLSDIRRSQQVKNRLAPKWWETTVVMMLFISALGLLASVFEYFRLRDRPVNLWMLFWLALFVLTVLFSFEFLVMKISNLRRANELMLRLLEDQQKQHEVLAKKVENILREK